MLVRDLKLQPPEPKGIVFPWCSPRTYWAKQSHCFWNHCPGDATLSLSLTSPQFERSNLNRRHWPQAARTNLCKALVALQRAARKIQSSEDFARNSSASSFKTWKEENNDTTVCIGPKRLWAHKAWTEPWIALAKLQSNQSLSAEHWALRPQETSSTAFTSWTTRCNKSCWLYLNLTYINILQFRNVSLSPLWPELYKCQLLGLQMVQCQTALDTRPTLDTDELPVLLFNFATDRQPHWFCLVRLCDRGAKNRGEYGSLSRSFKPWRLLWERRAFLWLLTLALRWRPSQIGNTRCLEGPLRRVQDICNSSSPGGWMRVLHWWLWRNCWFFSTLLRFNGLVCAGRHIEARYGSANWQCTQDAAVLSTRARGPHRWTCHWLTFMVSTIWGQAVFATDQRSGAKESPKSMSVQTCTNNNFSEYINIH